MNLVYKYTFESDHRIPMAALIAHGSRQIKHGVNAAKSHPRQKVYYNPFRNIHAELDAIIGLPKEALDGATIYICRRLTNGDVGLAKPCYVCEEVIKSVGIKKIVYSVNGYYGHICYKEIKVESL
jgi:deoxycytidylate deaminase